MTEISELTQKIAQQMAIKKTADTTATQASDDHTSILGDLGTAKQEADSIEISFNQASDAAKTADDNLNSALSSLGRAEDGIKSSQEALESAKESGNEELIQKMQTNVDRATQAYEKAKTEVETAKEQQGVTQQAKVDAETQLENSKNNVSKLTQDETTANTTETTAKATAEDEGNKLTQLDEQKTQLEAEQAAKEKQEVSDKEFDEAMGKAANNIKNADGAFDGKKDGASTHLEQSIALANQSEEDRKNIQSKLTKEFDSTDHNFDKEAGKSATHGYAVEDRDLADLNEVTGMMNGSSAENVAKMYQCAVPLNGDDVFKMEADTVAGLLEESKTGFSDANKAKILNAIDNGLQGETPVTNTKYDRQVVDVFTDNYTTEVSDADLEKQINTLKDKVSGKNPEALTEKEFRAITYLYDIEAGGEKIGITNWDGSLGVQEGQKFNKKELEAMILVDDNQPSQGEIEISEHTDVGNGSALWKISKGNAYSNYGKLDANSTGINIDPNNPLMAGVARGDKKGFNGASGGKQTFTMTNAYSNVNNYADFLRENDSNKDGITTYKEISENQNIELTEKYKEVEDFGIDIDEFESYVTNKEQLAWNKKRSKNNALNSGDYATVRDARMDKYTVTYKGQSLSDMPFYKKAPKK